MPRIICESDSTGTARWRYRSSISCKIWNQFPRRVRKIVQWIPSESSQFLGTHGSGLLLAAHGEQKRTSLHRDNFKALCMQILLSTRSSSKIQNFIFAYPFCQSQVLGSFLHMQEIVSLSIEKLQHGIAKLVSWPLILIEVFIDLISNFQKYCVSKTEAKSSLLCGKIGIA